MASRDYTKLLFLGGRILCSPLEAIFTLLIFIMSKDLGASAWQITILASSKPIVSIFAFYASSFITGRPDRIRKYLFAANCAGCIPCLFFPLVENIWFYVASYALFIAAQRAAFPAWNQILKENLGLKNIGSIVSKGTSINYLVTICIPLLFTFWMDNDKEIWKTLFFIVAILQLVNVLLLSLLQLKTSETFSYCSPGRSFRSIVIDPWREGVKLLMKHPDFAKYLLMFFIGGAGLIAIQPILPVFFKENLGLSYKELALAISFCKGVAFVSTSSLWARWSQHISLYLLNCYANLFSCLFIALLVASDGNSGWLFLAFLMYGTMQAGCEISWNLSGPVFSKENESTGYSSLNLALVGIRGCICPVAAQLLFVYTNAIAVFVYAGFVCFLSLVYALWLDRSCKQTSCQKLEPSHAL